MSSNQFCDELRIALTGFIPASDIERHVSYYRNYIGEQLASGRTNEEIFSELQSPQVIAKTIIASEEAKADASENIFARMKEDRQSAGGFFGGDFFSKNTFENGTMGQKTALGLIILLAVIVLLAVFDAAVKVLFWPVVIVAAGCVGWEYYKQFTGKGTDA